MKKIYIKRMWSNISARRSRYASTVYFVAFEFIMSDLTKSLLLIINLQQYKIHCLQKIILIVVLQFGICDWLLAMACWWMACICAMTLA